MQRLTKSSRSIGVRWASGLGACAASQCCPGTHLGEASWERRLGVPAAVIPRGGTGSRRGRPVWLPPCSRPALMACPRVEFADRGGVTGGERSEEHTSELQSRGHLVCRLLLEKKKKK